jgi:hypothetical protein
MDPLDEWFQEYDRLNAALRPFYDRISSKQGRMGHWKTEPTEPEKVLDDLWYFYSAALVNNADVSRYVDFMVEHKKELQMIGGRGCLAALEKLMPFYKEQQNLATEEQKEDHWRATMSAQEKAAALAEDSNEFARLLLAYAKRNANKIG